MSKKNLRVSEASGVTEVTIFNLWLTSVVGYVQTANVLLNYAVLQRLLLQLLAFFTRNNLENPVHSCERDLMEQLGTNNGATHEAVLWIQALSSQQADVVNAWRWQAEDLGCPEKLHCERAPIAGSAESPHWLQCCV